VVNAYGWLNDPANTRTHTNCCWSPSIQMKSVTWLFYQKESGLGNELACFRPERVLFESETADVSSRVSRRAPACMNQLDLYGAVTAKGSDSNKINRIETAPVLPLACCSPVNPVNQRSFCFAFSATQTRLTGLKRLLSCLWPVVLLLIL
jgi:hypothetical protein